MKPTATGDLFPDAAAIQAALERHTRDALLRRRDDTRTGRHVEPVIRRPDDAIRPNEATAARLARVSPENEPTADTPPAQRSGVAGDQAAGDFAALDPAARRRARGIGFSLDLVRALFDGRKSQTRRLIRPLPAAPPRAEDCPLGGVGDWLYVREPYLPQADRDGRVRYAYAADATAAGRRFRPAMAMPRDAARLWLRIGFVRAERLSSISAADLLAEGLPPGQTLARVWDSFYAGPGERWADDPWVWALGFDVRQSEPASPRPVER